MVNSDKLKGRMREKRITQAELAAFLGLKPSTTNQKINNIRPFHLEEVEMVVKLLDISIADFESYFFAR